MTAAALCALAVLDGAFSGFRAAAGRDAHLAKRGYYAAAMAYGAIASLALLALLLVWIAETIGIADHPVHRYTAYLRAGHVMLWVFVPYAALVVAALIGYVALPFEGANLMTVLVLGPFTFARPYVVIAGTTAAALSGGDGTVAVSCALAGAGVLGSGPLVGLLYRS